tara:strand:- start:54 stop:1031 length:978 start_codon:yes stop_codon:yes gene_type:complete
MVEEEEEDKKTKFETFAEMYVEDMQNVYLKSLKTMQNKIDLKGKKINESEIDELYKKIIDYGTSKTGGLAGVSARMIGGKQERELKASFDYLKRMMNETKKINFNPSNPDPHYVLKEIIESIKDTRPAKLRESKEMVVEDKTPKPTSTSDEKPMTAQEREAYEKEKKEKEKKKVKYGPNYIKELNEQSVEKLKRLMKERSKIETEFQNSLKELNNVFNTKKTSIDFSSLKIDLVYDTPEKIREALLDKEIIDREQQKLVRDLPISIKQYQKLVKTVEEEMETQTNTIQDAIAEFEEQNKIKVKLLKPEEGSKILPSKRKKEGEEK